MVQARYGVRDEITDTARTLYRAISSKNLKAIDTIWAHEPYASVAGRSGHLRQGWVQVHGYWEQRFEQLGQTNVAAKLRNPLVHAVGDVAWLSGTEIRTVTKENEVRHEELRMTCVLERRGSNWQIVSYHASEGADAVKRLANAS
ncbi:MAG: nuclear transport factor 2 family protein [Chloroflexota bacterium]